MRFAVCCDRRKLGEDFYFSLQGLTTEGTESTEEKSAAGVEKLFQRTAISGFQVASFRFPVSLPAPNSVNFVNFV